MIFYTLKLKIKNNLINNSLKSAKKPEIFPKFSSKYEKPRIQNLSKIVEKKSKIQGTYHSDWINWIDDGEEQNMIGSGSILTLATRLFRTVGNDTINIVLILLRDGVRLTRVDVWVLTDCIWLCL